MKIKWSLDINTGAVERSEAARARRLAGVTVVGLQAIEHDEGRPYISAIDGPAGPFYYGDHLTRDSPSRGGDSSWMKISAKDVQAEQ